MAKNSEVFSDEEKEAIKQRAAELKAQKGKKVDDEPAILAAIEKMTGDDQAIATELHRLVRKTAPELTCKTWYGFPAYCLDGKVLCFFQPASKFSTRYSTLGFNDIAALDDGDMWPAAYAITAWTPAVAKQITALVKKAVG